MTLVAASLTRVGDDVNVLLAADSSQACFSSGEVRASMPFGMWDCSAGRLSHSSRRGAPTARLARSHRP